MMRRLIAVLVLLLVRLAAQEPAAAFREIDRNLRELTAISGLKARKRVAYEMITRERVHDFLRKRVKEVVKPEEIRAEELALKKFGFVPADFNLEKSTVELLTEQAAALYDFRKKKLFLTDWTSSDMQETALVHELAHALADQNFDLERFIERAGKSDDGSIAALAVMEGQASWLMAEVLARKTGQTLKGNPAFLESMIGATETGTAQYPVFSSMPLYMRETLVFPYTAGMRFQQALLERMGMAGFQEIFRRPPVTTQQILHPEKYFAGVAPTRTRLPPTAGTRGFKRLVDGMVGEMDHAILLRQYASKDEAEAIAPHWRGGAYAVFENQARTRSVLAYAVEWDSAEVARRYFECYRQVLRKKWKKMEVQSESDEEIRGIGDDGHFVVRLNGATLTSLEGLERSADLEKPERRSRSTLHLDRELNLSFAHQ